MDRTAGADFKFNEETELIPIFGLIESQLNSPPASSNPDDASSIQEDHHPELLALLSSELSVSPEAIYDLEL